VVCARARVKRASERENDTHTIRDALTFKPDARGRFNRLFIVIGEKSVGPPEDFRIILTDTIYTQYAYCACAPESVVVFCFWKKLEKNGKKFGKR